MFYFLLNTPILVLWLPSIEPPVKDPKVSPAELEYRSLIFAFIDNCKPTPKQEQAKGKNCISSISLEH